MTEHHTDAIRKERLSRAKQILLERRLRGELDRVAPANTIPAQEHAGPIPLSYGQERMWFLWQLDPTSPAYNVYNVVRFRGKLNKEVLTKSLRALIHRHQILRTRFVTNDGRPHQQIVPGQDFEIFTTDLQSLTQTEKENKVQELIRAEIRRPFDLSKWPLLRALLLRQADDDHILVLTIHHIIFDEWSSEVFWRELSALYRTFSDGQTPSLPDLQIQYADFALWQKRQVNEQMETQLAYWKRQLGSELSVLHLPTDHLRPAQQSFAGAHTWLRLPDALCSRLKALNQAFGTTTFMTLLAAFQLLLHRYTGQTDIPVGTPIANRSRTETKDLVGFFLNTLVMRADFADNPRFDDLVKQVRQTALEGYAHQDLPFEKLVDALHPHRDVSQNPIFQVMFVHQRSFSSEIKLPGLTATQLPADSGVAKFDLTLFVQESEQGLRVGLEYNTDLFNAGTADRILDHFQTLLTSIVQDPQRRVSELPLMTAAERETLLHEWNDTASSPVPDSCVHELIEKHADHDPDAIAVVDPARTLTYGELDRRANQLARYLQKLGVGANTPVGLLLERSTEMAVAILGVLKAGGAYLPLDPAYPQDRLAFMLADTRAPVVLAQKRWAGSLPECEAQTVFIDAEWAAIAREDGVAPNIATVPDNLVYVIYTSGSTGTPKGVPVSHRNLVHFVLACVHFHEIPVDRFLLLSSFTFDSSMDGIFWTLCQGGTLVLPPQRIEQDMQQLATTIAEHQISHVLMLPSLYAILLEQADPEQLASLRAVIVAGEECRRGLVDRHYARLPHATLYNEYGPTETTVWSTGYKIPPDFEGDRVPIGQSIPNMQNYILDRHGHLAPIGVPGELCIGGAGVTSGYLHRPDLTAQRFVEHSFAGEPPIRVYHTGDLARYLPDGNIEFLGRIDHQVKIRGFRIEPGEIEVCLDQHPAVRQAVVVVHTPDVQADSAPRQLVAYVEPVNGQKASVTELRHFMLDRLPEYMVPRAFVLLDALPVTPNGKVDRQRLPAPDTDLTLTEDTAFVAPRTPVEGELSAIWASVLGVKRVGVHDNFFELGGDSILSIQILARAARQNIKLKPDDIFRYPTVAGLAGVAEVGGLEAEKPQTAVMGQVRLTPIQHWFFEQPLTEPHHWNQSYLLELASDADLAWIESCLQQLFLHHDALRMRYSRTETGWTQETAGPEQSMQVFRIDFSGLTATEQQAALEAEATKLQASLDLARGGLAQAAIFELGPGRSARLLLVIHHLVVDAVSWQILLEDLETTYQQLQQGLPVQLPLKTSSYQQWAEQLAGFAQSAELKQDLDYWLMDPASSDLSLSPDFAGDAAQNTVGSVVTVSATLSPDETRALLQQVPAAYQTQINDALLAALLLTFVERTGTNTLLLDLEGHGRQALFKEIDLSRTVGWFTTVSPLCLSLAKGASVGEALRSVKEQLRRMPRKGLSYGLLRYLSQDSAVREQLARRPAPQVTFNYLGQFDQTLPGFSLFRAAPEPVGPERSPHDPRRYLLEINSMVEQGQLTAKWSYSRNCFLPQTMDELAGSFMRHLRAIIEHCTTPGVGGYTPSDFPLAQLSQDQLDGLALKVSDNSRAAGVLNASKNIEDIYPLTPMQQLMLFHAVSQPDSGILFTQARYTLTGAIDCAALSASWQQIVARHPALRTAFEWTETNTPVQVVWRQARLDFEQLDLQHLSPAEQRAELAAILEADRARGFKLVTPPLMRLTLVHLADDRAELIWSSHHLIMDRWCINILLEEMLLGVDKVSEGVSVPMERAYPFSDYVDWLQQQDEQEAETFWRQRLAGFVQPTLLVGSFTTPLADTLSSLQLGVPQQTLRRLEAIARQYQLTMNTLTQAAWALLLSLHCQAEDVVFGATVSGRPADVTGVESIVGSFINNLPVRIKLDREMPLSDWLQAVQAQQIAMRPYEHVNPATVHSWSDIPNHAPFFDTLVVFQAPIFLPADLSETINVTEIEGDLATTYPFTLSVFQEGDQLRLSATFDSTQMGEPAVEQLLIRLTRLFEMITENMDGTVGKMLDWAGMEPLQLQPIQQRDDAPRLSAAMQSTSNDETVLLDIWRNVLQVDNIGVADSFFDLGGNSLLAARLFAQIEQATGIQLPIATLLHSPTIEQMASALRREDQSVSWSTLLTLTPRQAGSERPAVFMVPGASGQMVWYHDLARHLGPEQPFHGFQARGLDGIQAPRTRVEAMADHYVEEMRRVQPQGPYILAGMCFGGNVAFEMAQQLRKHPDRPQVALLAMIDTVRLPQKGLGARIRFALGNFFELDLRTKLSYLWHVSVGRFSAGRRHRESQRLKTERQRVQGVEDTPVWTACVRAWEDYHPQVYPGRLVLFRAGGRSPYNPYLGWNGMAAGGIEVYDIPTGHYGLIREPGVQVLAQKLRACIDQGLGMI